MKTKKMFQKLILNKSTVSNLEGIELSNARGGNVPPETEGIECPTAFCMPQYTFYVLECMSEVNCTPITDPNG